MGPALMVLVNGCDLGPGAWLSFLPAGGAAAAAAAAAACCALVMLTGHQEPSLGNDWLDVVNRMGLVGARVDAGWMVSGWTPRPLTGR